MGMCFAPDCKHYGERDTCRFFSFPKDDSAKKRWIKLLQREDKQPTVHSRVCSCHFQDGLKANGPTNFSKFTNNYTVCKEELNITDITIKEEQVLDSDQINNGTIPIGPPEVKQEIDETIDTDNKQFNINQSNSQVEADIPKNKDSNFFSFLQSIKLKVCYQEPDYSNFKYRCEICNERFCFPNIFQDHVNMHIRLKPYKCNLCNKQYATMLHLSQHQEDHAKGNVRERKNKHWQCEVCKRYFRAPSLLKTHLLQHDTNRKKELCNICGIEFFQLRNHIRKCHEKSYSHKCDQCGKKFNALAYLWVHKNKHNDNKRYCCDLCGKTFTFASGLKSHKKSHIFVSCEICKKSFTSKLVYKKHLKINACSSGLTSHD